MRSTLFELAKAALLRSPTIIHVAKKVSPRSQSSWQARKGNSLNKVALICPILVSLRCQSVLDVGCNAGEVTRLLGQRLFAVGIDQDIDLRGHGAPLTGACLGEIKLDIELIKKLPEFDTVCLFSVHHQWHASYGSAVAIEMVKSLATKAKRAFFIEFAALNAKYGEPFGSLFLDNEEQSVRGYAESWLAVLLPNHSCSYIGKTPESTREPYRFMFSCIP